MAGDMAGAGQAHDEKNTFGTWCVENRQQEWPISLGRQAIDSFQAWGKRLGRRRQPLAPLAPWTTDPPDDFEAIILHSLSLPDTKQGYRG